MKRQRYLISGATCFVGSNLIRKLVDSGCDDIHVLTRPTSNEWRLEGIPGLTRHQVDLREREKLFEIVKGVNPNVIFHLATQGVYSGRHLDIEESMGINFMGAKNLIDACDEIDYSCFINTGTSSEYGPKNRAMNEDNVCAPISLYGISKNAATQYGQFIAKSREKPIISARLFTPYGPYDREDRLVSRTIMRALQDKDLDLANPEAARDYIYIDDVCEVYLKMVPRAEEFKGEIFNVGSGVQREVSEVVETIMGLTGSKSRINWGSYPTRTYDTKIWVADMGKTKSSFDWKPKYDLQTGLAKSIQWYKENLARYNS